MTTQEQGAIPVPQVEERTPIPKQNLRVPGPTPIPSEVLAAQTNPMINHRGPEFAAIARRVTARLQYFFQTTSPVLTFPASGTGGQESAVVNLFSPGDHVVAITIGNFGNRLAKIAEAYGLNVTRIEFPWGQAADPASVEARLKELPSYKGVLLTHNETSTGVTNDLEALAALIRRLAPETLIVVDAVSSAGSIPLDMDRWDLDAVFTGSQKGWMTPPGIMMIAASPRAWEANKTARLPRFYFDWGPARKQLLEKGQHPTTPAVSVFYALDVALEMMLAEGREAIFARQQQAGDYVRGRVRAMGLQLFADHQNASNTVTAIKVPEGIDSKALLKKLREQDRIVFAGGQAHLEGKIFRIGHLGYFTEADLAQALDTLEQRLHEFGFKS
ncbi:alanine--glyoxylate aminotransferase family protein [Ktedonosporobacter rubrisoli]|uniref:Alanine--glyoxylate aminotransferase family protein n=1 Tax=Ktedonosporobacter rubrisoli TaxID=2509675 RepID=A0A4P6K2E7_KTERU|nr:alanine--glyoxylate aminotransferase family protein [Ktedonosporobacter rubrisoli]QBD82314.1 alanine--glyoxylate aminotransferase family protein [Ktedonosporobacter rubrisoli]